MFTDQKKLIDLVIYEAPLGKSDHPVLTWQLLLSTQQLESKQVKFNYYKSDYQSIQASVQTVNWKERWKGCTVGEMWTDLRETLTSLVALHVPLKRMKREKEKDYLSRYGRRLAKEVKNGASTVNTVQEETSASTNS